MKKFLAAILLCLLITISFSCQKPNPGPGPEPEPPVTSAPQKIVVDSTVSKLLSSEQELDAFIFSEGADETPKSVSWEAVRVIKASPKKRRRSWLLSTGIFSF